MIETVVFDLDDTLCEYRRSGAEVLDLAFQQEGVSPFFTVEDYYGVFEDHAERGESVETIRERCFADLADRAGHNPALGRSIADTYRAHRDHSEVRFTEGAEAALDRLAADHRLALVTNGGPDMQRQKLSALGLTDRFESMVFAGYESAPKPAAEPFERVLDDLGADADRAVHVGNSLAADVAGAHAAGLRSAWVRNGYRLPDDGPTPHFALDSLADLHDPPWQ